MSQNKKIMITIWVKCLEYTSTVELIIYAQKNGVLYMGKLVS